MPVSVRLSYDVRAVPDVELRARGIGLSMYPRQLVSEATHRRPEQIKRQSRAAPGPTATPVSYSGLTPLR